MSEDFKPCERTVRMIMQAVKTYGVPLIHGGDFGTGYSTARKDVERTIQALLPDPAKALVEELAGESAAMSREFSEGACWAIKRLIDTGRIRSGE